MSKTRFQRWLPVAAMTAVLSACAVVPAQFQGDYTSLTPAQTSARDIGTEIRWGGVILDSHPDRENTCFEILSRNLNSSMQPVSSDQTTGRFIACKNGFHDPAVFAPGREVTLNGKIVRIDKRKVGEYDYHYPVVAAGFITMWPVRPDVIRYDRYDPFFEPFYWYDPWFRPYPYAIAPRGRAYKYPPGSRERIDIPNNRQDRGESHDQDDRHD